MRTFVCLRLVVMSMMQGQMEAKFTLVVRFGERGLAKKYSELYTRGELVSYLATKWDGISTKDIFLSYDLFGTRELNLADDEDLTTMFRLMREMQTHRVRIYVRRLSEGGVGPRVGRFDNGGMKL